MIVEPGHDQTAHRGPAAGDPQPDQRRRTGPVGGNLGRERPPAHEIQNPGLQGMLGAGGAAFVVQRGRGHELLGSAFRTDGSFSLDVLVPVGGTKAPISPENADGFRLRVTDPAGMRERLEAKSMANFAGVVRDAVARSGAGLEDVAYVAMLHVKRSAHEALLNALGVPLERSIYLSDYGHIGQVDQALSLELARREGRLRPGDLVVLVAAGVGYVWNAICLRWGEGGAP